MPYFLCMNTFGQHYAHYRSRGFNYLRMKLPEIKRLESLEELRDLKLVREVAVGDILFLVYTATSPWYPHIRRSLVERRIVRRSAVSRTSVEYEGTDKEFVRTHLHFYCSRLQVILDVRDIGEQQGGKLIPLRKKDP